MTSERASSIRYPSRHRVRRWICFFLLVAVAVGTASGVVVDHVAPDPITLGTGAVDGTKKVAVDSISVDYGSGGASGMTVVVNNTGGELTVTVTGELRTLDGSSIASSSETMVLTSDGKATVTLTFASSHARSEYEWIHVHVQ